MSERQTQIPDIMKLRIALSAVIPKTTSEEKLSELNAKLEEYFSDKKLDNQEISDLNKFLKSIGCTMQIGDKQEAEKPNAGKFGQTQIVK